MPRILCTAAVLLIAASLLRAADKPDTDAAREEAKRRARAAAGVGTPASPLPQASVPPEFAPPPTGWPTDAPRGMSKAVKVDGIDDPAAHFHLFVPGEYTSEKEWPLMLVLHGGPGGRAADLAHVLAGRITDRQCIAIFPQALKAQVLEWNYPHEGAYLMRIIKQAAKTYRIDPKRVYLIGHSMGGGGTFANGAVLSDIFAAIGPMSGWFWAGASPRPSADEMNWLKQMPAYILHGEKDQAVPVKLGQMADEALKKIGNTNYVYRELPGIGHDVPRYGEELNKLVDWVLLQKRSQPANFAEAGKKLAQWGKHFHWTLDAGLGTYKGE